jgi:hypothetical protein
MFINDVGSIGLISDKPPHSLPVNAWSEGQNVRMYEGGVEKVTGHRSAIGTPTVAPYFLLPVKSGSDALWVYCGNNGIYATAGGAGGTHKNITRSSGAYTASSSEQVWTGLVFGGVPILNNGSDVPQMWSPVNFSSPQLLQDLSNWPTGLQCKAISGFKQFMIAMDVSKTSGGTTTDYPRMIKWSDQAGFNSVPASWDETVASGDAGEYELSDSQGNILMGKQLRDSFLIYKTDSIWGMNYIGSPYIFRFYEVSKQYGALSRHSVVEVEGGHVVLANGDLLLCDGQSVKSLMTQRMRRYLFDSIDPDNYGNSFLSLNQPKNEIWICYPTTGEYWPNRAVVWNYKENTFGVRDLPVGTTYATNGVVNPSDSLTWSTTDTWDDGDDPWDSRVYNPSQTRLMMANKTSTKLFLADTTNQFDSVNATSFIERTGLHFDKPNIIKLVTRVSLNFEKFGSGTVEVLVGSHNSPEGAVTWSTPTTVDPTSSADSKVDVLVSGKYLAIKIQSSSDVGWKLHSYDMAITEMGTD